MASKVEDFWQEKLTEWKDSGESISDYCKTNRLHVGSFYKWKNRLLNGEPLDQPKRLTNPPKSAATKTSSFVEVELPLQPAPLLSDKTLRITTSYGAVIEVPL